MATESEPRVWPRRKRTDNKNVFPICFSKWLFYFFLLCRFSATAAKPNEQHINYSHVYHTVNTILTVWIFLLVYFEFLRKLRKIRMDDFGALLIRSVKFRRCYRTAQTQCNGRWSHSPDFLFNSRMGWSDECERCAYAGDLLTQREADELEHEIQREFNKKKFSESRSTCSSCIQSFVVMIHDRGCLEKRPEQSVSVTLGR